MKVRRLGNGKVRYSYPGGFYDVDESRFSEMELRLMEAEAYREAGGPGMVDPAGQAAAFVARYDGHRYDRANTNEGGEDAG